jgi:prephenate dehydrogenase
MKNKDKTRKEVGIIGFGNFGRFIAKHLKDKLGVCVTDVADKRKEAEEIGVTFTSLENIVKKKIIILAVPMKNLKGILERIKNKLQPEALILDVCSLKMFSCKLMKETLPENVEIIGTHPLFGPQSASNSIKGMKVALCNVNARQETLEKIKRFCESLGLKAIVTTPEEHDKQMAVSQALTHFIGQTAKHMGLKRVELSTKTFDDLMSIIDIIKNDTPALFENMQTMNPFAKKIREKFIEESMKLDRSLNKKIRRKIK